MHCRAPYDNIFLNGITLRKLAQALPAEEVVYMPATESRCAISLGSSVNHSFTHWSGAWREPPKLHLQDRLYICNSDSTYTCFSLFIMQIAPGSNALLQHQFCLIWMVVPSSVIWVCVQKPISLCGPEVCFVVLARHLQKILVSRFDLDMHQQE